MLQHTIAGGEGPVPYPDRSLIVERKTIIDYRIVDIIKLYARAAHSHSTDVSTSRYNPVKFNG